MAHSPVRPQRGREYDRRSWLPGRLPRRAPYRRLAALESDCAQGELARHQLVPGKHPPFTAPGAGVREDRGTRWIRRRGSLDWWRLAVDLSTAGNGLRTDQ